MQNVQEGECSLIGMQLFDTVPRLYWPNLLQILLGPDINLVQHVFGFRTDIDEM